MKKLNQVTLQGYLYNTPRSFKGKIERFALLEIVCENAFKTKKGEDINYTVRVKARATGVTADYLLTNFKKNDRITLSGELRNEELENGDRTGFPQLIVEVQNIIKH
ncbi:hypothetical protein [Poritiphilus flavus]|uniref:Single-stranded DNA-binding protein n=1 Tax=Poritiphilus flavus TaxID=2697053 RepID=A0A6L9EEE4_9FLAO|nr:hypothetical protein [Poritiphilus flavus]NAS12918.1 hypothetical protein [Poritiphilus flavus]